MTNALNWNCEFTISSPTSTARRPDAWVTVETLDVRLKVRSPVCRTDPPGRPLSKIQNHGATLAPSQWDDRRKVIGKCLSSNPRQTFSKGVEVSSETRSFLKQPHGSPFVTTHTTLLCHRSFRLCLIHYSESTRTHDLCAVLSCHPLLSPLVYK